MKKADIRTVVVKGVAAVDHECSEKLNVAHVYAEGNDIYDAMLNQVYFYHFFAAALWMNLDFKLTFLFSLTIYCVTDVLQTDAADNHNKYYIIQLLEDDTQKAYSVWLRWGRVGYKVRMFG